MKTTDRGLGVARIETAPSAGDAGPDEERIARLERTGVIRRPRSGRLQEIVSVLPPVTEPGADIVAAVIEERRSGR